MYTVRQLQCETKCILIIIDYIILTNMAILKKISYEKIKCPTLTKNDFPSTILQ